MGAAQSAGVQPAVTRVDTRVAMRIRGATRHFTSPINFATETYAFLRSSMNAGILS